MRCCHYWISVRLRENFRRVPRESAVCATARSVCGTNEREWRIMKTPGVVVYSGACDLRQFWCSHHSVMIPVSFDVLSVDWVDVCFVGRSTRFDQNCTGESWNLTLPRRLHKKLHYYIPTPHESAARTFFHFIIKDSCHDMHICSSQRSGCLLGCLLLQSGGSSDISPIIGSARRKLLRWERLVTVPRAFSLEKRSW